ncbi:cysteine desulfurase [Konateibacter massiliensis]|uniref:cysteine desulfurase n=1 Tax=Konateibacter massiliensis TaxID=2002841 RepID=UPI000C15550D|nr:cysteine desulfurase [Konateibacter massiliensis]
MIDFSKDFPLLQTTDEMGRRLAYLDNAATTQKPFAVLDAEADYYKNKNANPHRGAYDLSMKATQVLESVREKTKRWLHVPEDGEVIFTKNATESLNLVAYSYAMNAVSAGDEIVLAVSEHHSNLVPWQNVAKAKGAVLTYLYLNEEGRVTKEEAQQKITTKTKLVAIAQVSNVTGYVNPVEDIIEMAHKVQAVVVVDGTQGAPHLFVDLGKLEADFYAFSGHKMLAPMGIGVLYGKKKLLEQMPPFLYGGDMIEYVEEQTTTFAPVPQKFEAGTQNMGSIAGFGAAIDYIEKIGMNQIRSIEDELTAYLIEKLKGVPHLTIVGSDSLENRIGVVPFVIEGVHPHDVVTIVNKDLIAIRSGNHCAQPLHNFLKVPATCRASVYLYNSKDEIDRLAESLKGVRRWLGYGA